MTIRQTGVGSLADRSGSRATLWFEWHGVAYRDSGITTTFNDVPVQYRRALARQGMLFPGNAFPGSSESWPQGASGKGAGSVGLAQLNGYPTLRMLPGAAAGAPPNDFFPRFAPIIPIGRPAYDWRNPWGVWEVGTVMGVAAAASSPTRDVGLSIHADSQTTAFATGLLGSSLVPLPSIAGLYLGWKGQNGQLEFASRPTPGAALAERVDVGTPIGTDVLAKIVVRFLGATTAQDAQLKVYVNDRLVLTRSWGAPTTLPTFATAGNLFTGLWRPFVRQDNEAGVGPVLHVARFWVAAGEDESVFA